MLENACRSVTEAIDQCIRVKLLEYNALAEGEIFNLSGLPGWRNLLVYVQLYLVS